MTVNGDFNTFFKIHLYLLYGDEFNFKLCKTLNKLLLYKEKKEKKLHVKPY
jgi:hypothetical protein